MRSFFILLLTHWFHSSELLFVSAISIRGRTDVVNTKFNVVLQDRELSQTYLPCNVGTYLGMGQSRVDNMIRKGIAITSDIAACGTADEVLSSVPGNLGVWYWTIGTGYTMQASTCSSDDNSYTNFDTQITVMTMNNATLLVPNGVGDGVGFGINNNNDNCNDNLICIAGNKKDDQCDDNSSTVTWESSLSTIYYILVHSGDSIQVDSQFSISLKDMHPLQYQQSQPGQQQQQQQSSQAQVTVQRHPPSNDQCTASHLLVLDDYDSSNNSNSNVNNNAKAISSITTFGTTIGATAPTSSTKTLTNGNCASMIQDSGLSPAVWYKVHGTGDVLAISTCSNPSNSFYTSVSVMEVVGNDECDLLSCIGSSSSAIDSAYKPSATTMSALDPTNSICFNNKPTTSIVVWQSSINTDYYVLVHGTVATATGDFAVQLQSVPRGQDPLIDDMLMGYDMDKMLDEEDEEEIEDELDNILAETLNDEINNNIEQQAENEEDKELEQMIHHAVDEAEQKEQAQEDAFSLGGGASASQQQQQQQKDYNNNNNNNENTGAPSNDQCKNAMDVDFDHEKNDMMSFFGSTLYAKPDYNIVINSRTRSSNSRTCGMAELPTRGTFSNNHAPGIWYHLIGTGSTMRVSTCEWDSYDTQIAVFQTLQVHDDSGVVNTEQSTGKSGITGAGIGDVNEEIKMEDTYNKVVQQRGYNNNNNNNNDSGDERLKQIMGYKKNIQENECNNLLCVDGDDDSCDDGYNKNSVVTFMAEKNVPYYIYVFGDNGDSGNFRLEISMVHDDDEDDNDNNIDDNDYDKNNIIDNYPKSQSYDSSIEQENVWSTSSSNDDKFEISNNNNNNGQQYQQQQQQQGESESSWSRGDIDGNENNHNNNNYSTSKLNSRTSTILLALFVLIVFVVISLIVCCCSCTASEWQQQQKQQQSPVAVIEKETVVGEDGIQSNNINNHQQQQQQQHITKNITPLV